MQILAVVDSYLPATSGSPPAMKCGTCIANTARALIFDRDAVARALESGHLAGYDGDVVRESLERWFDNCPIRQEYLIVQDGRLAGSGTGLARTRSTHRMGVGGAVAAWAAAAPYDLAGCRAPAYVSGRARYRARAARGSAAGALQDAVQHVVVVVEALVLAGVAGDEAPLELVRPGFFALPAADKPFGIRGVQPMHALPGLALQGVCFGDHAFELVGETGEPGVTGSHMGGAQGHDSVAQEPSSVLEIGDVMQLDAGHASDPYGVFAHLSTFRARVAHW